MTFLMMVAALISVLVDRLGGVEILIVGVLLYLLYRVARTHFHVSRRSPGSDTGGARVIDELPDPDFARPAQRVTHYRVLGNDLVPAGEFGGIVTEQHFSDLDGDFFIDSAGRVFTSEYERTRQQVRGIEDTLEAFIRARDASPTGEAHFVKLPGGGGISEGLPRLVDDAFHTDKRFKVARALFAKRDFNTLSSPGRAHEQRIEHVRPVATPLNLIGKFGGKTTPE
jgi:hypothetical protein